MIEAILLALSAAGLLVLYRLWNRALGTLRTHREQWTLVTQGAPDVLWHLDLERNAVTASERIWDWTGKLPGGVQELFDRRHEFLRAEEYEKLRQPILRFLESEDVVLDFEVRLTFPGREERWFRVRGQRGHGRRELAGSLSDVTEMKVLGTRLWEWSNIDPLTRLSNRHHLTETLGTLEEPYCLLLVDADHFSIVNDTYKHEGGDRMLRWLAQTLLSLFRSDDLVARWGGDEFVIAVRGSLSLAETLAQRIHETLTSPVPMHPAPWNLSVSIGIVPCSGEERDIAGLLQRAEEALHQAQSAGGDRTTVFTETIRAQSARRILVERKLPGAVGGGLRLAFQPQFRLSDRHITGFEALARWTDDELGVVPPSEFIPLAEQLGLIPQLGAWALTEACAFLARQPAEHRNSLTVAVNVSVLQLRDEAFVERAEQIVRGAGLSPASIELEITETILIQSFDETVSKLTRLRNLGFRIALDDFGQGYSSLSYLKVLPLDTLKIDKAFLEDGTSDSLLGAIIQLGRLLNLRVVAEGIESTDQVLPLISHGCHLVQGYLFSRPLETEQAQAFLRKTRAGSKTPPPQ